MLQKKISPKNYVNLIDILYTLIYQVKVVYVLGFKLRCSHEGYCYYPAA